MGGRSRFWEHTFSVIPFSRILPGLILLLKLYQSFCNRHVGASATATLAFVTFPRATFGNLRTPSSSALWLQGSVLGAK